MVVITKKMSGSRSNRILKSFSKLKEFNTLLRFVFQKGKDMIKYVINVLVCNFPLINSFRSRVFSKVYATTKKMVKIINTNLGSRTHANVSRKAISFCSKLFSCKSQRTFSVQVTSNVSPIKTGVDAFRNHGYRSKIFNFFNQLEFFFLSRFEKFRNQVKLRFLFHKIIKNRGNQIPLFLSNMKRINIFRLPFWIRRTFMIPTSSDLGFKIFQGRQTSGSNHYLNVKAIIAFLFVLSYSQMAIAIEIPSEIWNKVFVHVDPLVEGYYNSTMALGQVSNRNGMREKEDLFMRDLFASSPTYINATGGSNGDQPSNITKAAVDNIERLLLDNDARTMLETIEAEDKFGTAPTRDAFIALASTAITASLQGVSGVLLKNAYPDQSGIRPEEYCSISRFRFFVSSRGSFELNASSLGNTVYKVPMYGVESIAKIEQNNYTSRVGFRPDWVVSSVAQNSQLYAKFAVAAAISNQQWLSGLRVTAAV